MAPREGVTEEEPAPEFSEDRPVPVKDEKPWKVVWALAWPAVALNSLQTINNLLDTTFVGRLESAALTAHGAAITIIFLMFSLAMALGTAATALVSRAYGAGDVPEYKKAARQCLSLAVISGILLATATALIAWPAAHSLLPADNPRAMELMTQYVMAWSVSLPAIHVIQVLAGSLRGVGDTKSPMYISGLQILLHICLNYVFIFPSHTVLGFTFPGLGLGLTGAAWALTVSAWLSAATYMVFATRTPLGEVWKLGVPARAWTGRILRISLPAAAQAVLRVGSLTAFVFVLGRVPNASTALASMRAGFAIESIMFMPGFGLSMAAAALVGQSLGMKRSDRAERLAWTAGHHGAGVMLALAVPIFLFADQIAHVLVGGKPDIAAEATMLIRYLSVTEVFFGYAMVMIGAMQGAGDTIRPMWITIVALWLIRVPLAFYLALPVGMGSPGAWIAMSVTQAVQGMMAIWLFKQGAWKLQKV